MCIVIPKAFSFVRKKGKTKMLFIINILSQMTEFVTNTEIVIVSRTFSIDCSQ
jgi:hypothetical protein